jgi:hypothetical protein
MKREGLSNSLVAVLFVVGILVGAAGYYLASMELVPTQISVSQSTTSAPSQSGCTAPEPLSLLSVAEFTYTSPIDTPVGVTDQGLTTVWSNCGNQETSFVAGSPSVNVTILAYGKTSFVSGSIVSVCPTLGCGSVGPHGIATVVLPLLLPLGTSSNAVVERISGNLTAADPVTGQAVSATDNFTT